MMPPSGIEGNSSYRYPRGMPQAPSGSSRGPGCR